MNIIEAVKLIKTGKKVKRKGKRNIDTIKDMKQGEHHYEIYDLKRGWLKCFLEDDILADDWEVVE